MSDESREGSNDVRGPVPIDRVERRIGASSAASAWSACILAGLAAGLIGFGSGEAVNDAFQPRKIRQQMGQGMAERPTPETIREAVVQNARVAYAQWGAVLGIALGLAGATTAGGAGRRLAGSIVGAVAGGLVGAVAPSIAVPIVASLRSDMDFDPMIAESLGLVAMWGAIAAAAALGFALGGRRPIVQSVVAAFAGAVVGTVVYLGASTTLFPLAETDHPIALVWQARLLARLLPSLGAVALLATVRPATPRDVPAA